MHAACSDRGVCPIYLAEVMIVMVIYQDGIE